MQFCFQKNRSDTWDSIGLWSAPSGSSELEKFSLGFNFLFSDLTWRYQNHRGVCWSATWTLQVKKFMKYKSWHPKIWLCTVIVLSCPLIGPPSSSTANQIKSRTLGIPWLLLKLFHLYREQKLLHRRYAFQILLDARNYFMSQPSLVNITVTLNLDIVIESQLLLLPEFWYHFNT